MIGFAATKEEIRVQRRTKPKELVRWLRTKLVIFITRIGGRMGTAPGLREASK